MTIQVSSTDVQMDDYSATFHKLRSGLVSSDGTRYKEFVRTLKPDYFKVYRDIAFGYLAVAASLVITFCIASQVSTIGSVITGSVLVGYWVAYLQLFMHEGAHYNLAEVKERSDFLCDTLIGWLVGIDVRSYRKVHFQHHRALGTMHDSEHTYFFPLNLLFVIKGLTGWRVVEVLMSRRRFLDQIKSPTRDKFERSPSDAGSECASKSRSSVMALGLLAHSCIVAIFFVFGWHTLVGAWLIGMFMIFPFFGALRQLLEHRMETADPAVDHFKTGHGAFSRMFGDDVFSATFGGAGFNRHLLHHWEPQISYTNLKELETYFHKTEMSVIINRRRSTYFETFAGLFSLY